MCKGKKCLGKNETNKLNFLERKWHRKSDIMNARRWDLFQFAYFTTNLCTSPPWQMREDRRLIFIPELWKRNKEKFQSVTLKKLRSLLKGAVSRLPNSFCFLCPNAIHASLFATKLEKIPVNDKITASCQTKFVSQTSYQWLKRTKMNFEKLLGGQVFKNHNYNPLHSSSSFSIPASYSICGVIYTFFKLFERLCISQFQLPPPPTPRLLRGICLPFQSRGWGICNFCSARGPCICQLPGLFPSFWHARGTHLPSFFVPTPGDLTTEESPPPGIWYQAKKKLLMPGNQRGMGGGGGLGLRAAGRSWNWLMQYFDDSLNFSGCNSHRLSFDIEFRDTSPLTLLLVVNAINAQGSCADHRRPLCNPVVVIVVRSPKRYSYLYGTGFWGVFLDEAFTWIRVHYSRDIQFWLVVISSQDQSINFGKKKKKGKINL